MAMSDFGDKLAAVKEYLLGLQRGITETLEEVDGTARFHRDSWEREGGGGGETRVTSGGSLLEQAGVNFSHVYGDNLPPSASKSRPELAGRGFQAMGVSLVLHPENPYVPTTHANVRGFAAEKPDSEPVWWFGGGFDLTPYSPCLEDVEHWHRTARDACEGFPEGTYPRFKDWCDEYFYLRHRGATRGVGGLVVGDHFLAGYLPIVERRRDTPWGEAERQFQLYRRGRYVEFNLVYDRGTLFGLQSGGRIESILMSLPPLVRWRYDWRPEEGTPEAALYQDYLRPRDWLGDT